MGDMMTKVHRLRADHAQLDIQVDGGVSSANIGVCARAGANSFVAGLKLVTFYRNVYLRPGTAIMKSADAKATINQMRQTATDEFCR
jgi:pentose-5-phosphate-3-epimerase